MLVITVKPNEYIQIGEIRIFVKRHVKANNFSSTRMYIDAPKEIPITRVKNEAIVDDLTGKDKDNE